MVPQTNPAPSWRQTPLANPDIHGSRPPARHSLLSVQLCTRRSTSLLSVTVNRATGGVQRARICSRPHSGSSAATRSALVPSAPSPPPTAAGSSASLAAGAVALATHTPCACGRCSRRGGSAGAPATHQWSSVRRSAPADQICTAQAQAMKSQQASEMRSKWCISSNQERTAQRAGIGSRQGGPVCAARGHERRQRLGRGGHHGRMCIVQGHAQRQHRAGLPQRRAPDLCPRHRLPLQPKGTS